MRWNPYSVAEILRYFTFVVTEFLIFHCGNTGQTDATITIVKFNLQVVQFL
jgi:hypothetical protein